MLAGGLRSEQLQRLVIENGQVTASEIVLDGQIGRIRDVRQGRTGPSICSTTPHRAACTDWYQPNDRHGTAPFGGADFSRPAGEPTCAYAISSFSRSLHRCSWCC
ncbi:hypothetical protein [Halomonas sp. E19]|uniref:hypothetical protein n=1 Tax=Halomonas sp. E19 TaxID=3397247 RepID=UPI0040344A60